MHRRILHVDMDAFFASVEQRDDPALRGRPVAVGGRGARGVVAAASYEARPFGVRSAMPMARARRLCPELVVVPGRFEAYREASQTVRAVFGAWTDLVEPLSLDEAYLDVTEPRDDAPWHTLPGRAGGAVSGRTVSGTHIAQAIRAEIWAQTGLTASAGVSFSKFLAKVASDLDKPDGLSVITPAEAPAFMAALPVERFHGVGPATARRLAALGIRTGADLLAWGEAALRRDLGKVGGWLHRVARCEDTRPVRAHRVRKSVGAERTFSRDVVGTPAHVDRIAEIAEILSDRLARHGVAGRTLTLKLRTPDFRTTTRSLTPGGAACETADLVAWARLLLFHPEPPGGRLRLIGLTASALVPAAAVGGRQLLLPFDGEAEDATEQA